MRAAGRVVITGARGRSVDDDDAGARGPCTGLAQRGQAVLEGGGAIGPENDPKTRRRM